MAFSIGPAAGWVKTAQQASRMLRSAANIIVLGSYTREPRGGNAGRTFAEIPEGTLNSLGLPNQGIAETERWLQGFIEEAARLGKRVRVSIAGFSPEEYADCAYSAFAGHAREIEINLGCPNVWGADGQKPIASFDPALMDEIIRRVRERLLSSVSLVVKLSPYTDPGMFGKAFEVLRKYDVRTIVTMNTVPNAYAAQEDGTPLIDVGNGLSGYAGAGIRPVALGQVRQFAALCTPMYRPRIEGVGGIEKAPDAIAMWRAGADGVLVGSAFFTTDDPRIFGDIIAGCPDDMFADS